MTGSSYYNIEKAAAWRSSGSTQTQGRVYNERLILSLVRMHGELSKVELTQLTALAPQTITSIVNEAAANALLVRGKPRRGGLGQPSVPYAINPAGAYGLGLRLHARGGEIVLVDFVGNPVQSAAFALPALEPRAVIEAVVPAVALMLEQHREIPADRIAGMGIASPFHGADWRAALALSRPQADDWDRMDLRAELDARFQWPVYLLPDGVVAAAGELMFGAGLGIADFLYIHLGERAGSGLVLNHHLYAGRNRLAGVIGDFPVLDEKTEGTGAQTLSQATALPSPLLATEAPDGALVEAWSTGASRALGGFIWRAISLLDIDTVIVDTDGGPGVTRALGRGLRRQLAASAARRPSPLAITDGRLGATAHTVGAASLPLMVRYSTDTDVLFK